jgi:4-amino-4-deoxy-L-arabinose transferase-like glycosyltransferase
MTQTRIVPPESFGFRYSDLFRISDFGFRISFETPLAQRLGLILLAAALFFLGLGDRDLNSSHEARAAQNAQMMLSEGDWLLPRLFDGHLELQKPPLYYWLVAVIGYIGGGQVGPWAVRLPAALSALGCILFLHLVGCRVGRPRMGFLAALVLASCLHFTWLARVGRIDMPLTFALTVAVGSFCIGQYSGRPRSWYFLGYTALGLGVLLKGPIALVLGGVVAISWTLLDRSRIHSFPGSAWERTALQVEPAGQCVPRQSLGTRFARASTLWWGLPWMLLIAAPWFIWANLETGGRLWDVFFWYHNVERGLGGSETLKANPWWFYLPTAAVDLLPWTLVLPICGWFWLRDRELHADREGRLGACWFIAILAFLSCMSFKRADYLLPAYPGFALLVACTLERFAIGRRLIIALATAMALGWGWYNAYIAPAHEADWPYQRIAQEIRAETDRPVIFFRAESHLLAFHLGRPLDTILEWENLRWWVERPFPVYIVMPEPEADDWPNHLPAGSLQEVLRTRDRLTGRRDHPVVVLRSRPR